MSKNTYDKFDRVERVAVVHAGALKLGAYRVRDPETDEWSAMQFHMVWDNTVMAVMSESSGKLFAKFITDNLPHDAATEASPDLKVSQQPTFSRET